jgi:hypothetical protein
MEKWGKLAPSSKEIIYEKPYVESRPFNFV